MDSIKVRGVGVGGSAELGSVGMRWRLRVDDVCVWRSFRCDVAMAWIHWWVRVEIFLWRGRVLEASEGSKGGTFIWTLAAVELFEGSALVPLVWAFFQPHLPAAPAPAPAPVLFAVPVPLLESPKLQVKALEY